MQSCQFVQSASEEVEALELLGCKYFICVRYIKVHAFGESLFKDIWKFCTIWMYKHKFPHDYCQLSMKLLATQWYLYLKAHPQGIVEIQSFVTGLNFFFAVQRNWWGKVWNVSMAIFPFVGGHELVLWVQPICLYVCLSVTSVCVLKWLGLPYEYTHSLLLCPNWVLGSWPSYFKCNLMCLLVYLCVHKVTRS